ncbi:MAG TPA: hypothetical protein DCL77_19830 [Prolixibacteraceae bacterium]|jgi:signal transduction histidine kinase|nr:hypothetical protein [Prolixibacteraceae bacterium]
MKTFILTLFFVLFWRTGYVQNSHIIDSLKLQLNTVKQDSVKARMLLNICEYYRWIAPDSTLKYVVEGLKLAEKSNLTKLYIRLLNANGEALTGKGNYSQALEIQFKALKLSEKVDDNIVRMGALMSVGSVYYFFDDFPKALQYFRQSRSISEKINNVKWEELNLGLVGEAYFNMGMFDSALIYIQRTYDLELKNKTKWKWSMPYSYMAKFNIKNGLLSKALENYQNGLNLGIDVLDSINAFLGIADVYNKIGMADSTIFYAKKGLRIGQRSLFNKNIIEASAQLKDIYRSKNLIDSAFKYQEIMIAAKDSLFSQEKIEQIQKITFEEQAKQRDLEASQIKYRNQIKIAMLLFAMAVLLIIGVMLWRKNRFKQRAFNLLEKQKQETEQQKANVENALTELKATQAQLIQSEKMASLGELTAGIAHEIQNPLNFVNNFSEVSNDLIEEMNEELDKGEIEEAKAIASDIKQNLEKILHHGKRADGIVKGMLQHSRTSSGVKEPTDINKLADEYFRLAYHGLRAKDKSFNATMKTDFDQSIGSINVIPQDIGRVILNLITNAFYAVTEKKKQQLNGYEPTVSVSTKKIGDMVLISVKDNGNGIPQKVMDKIFQPFFTTKPTGEGTGLGLSMSYDIVKAHGGELKVETKEGVGAEFVIDIPI